MGNATFRPDKGQPIGTDVPTVDASWLNRRRVALGSPAAASDTAVHATIPLTSAGAGQDITTAITNPDVPRVARIKGNASGNTGNVVITGKNLLGATVTDTIALNGATAVEGTKALVSISNIHVPPEVHAGTDTVSVGYGSVLGLSLLLDRNSVEKAWLAKTVEGTAPTVTVSATVIESNTVKLYSALNGTAVEVDIEV